MTATKLNRSHCFVHLSHLTEHLTQSLLLSTVSNYRELPLNEDIVRTPHKLSPQTVELERGA